MFRLSPTDFFDSNKRIIVLPRMPQEPFPEHSHSFHELVLVKSGSAVHISDGSAVHICKGSVLYLRENESHLFEQMENLCLINVLFMAEELQSADRLQSILTSSCHSVHGGMYLPALVQQQSEQLLNQIVEENNSQENYSQMMVESMFSQLAILLWRAKNQTKDSACGQDKIVALLSYINENYQNNIDWNALSERFSVPLRTLNRKVIEYVGMTPNNYLGRIRLCKASWMLAHTNHSVTNIAFDCGFNDGNYFSSKFHHAFEMTPLQYRKHYSSPHITSIN